jgi:hypothetical protein
MRIATAPGTRLSGDDVLGLRMDGEDVWIVTTGKPMHLLFPGLEGGRGRPQREWIRGKLREAEEHRRQTRMIE